VLALMIQRTAEIATEARVARSFVDECVELHVKGELPEGAGVLLVRPDGYAAWSGERPSADQVRTALTEWTGTP
jgi:hypothetical protein